MPFEHRQPRRQSAEHGIGGGRREENQIRPAGGDTAGVDDLAAGSDGQQLSAKTHSEHGDVLVQRGS